MCFRDYVEIFGSLATPLLESLSQPSKSEDQSQMHRASFCRVDLVVSKTIVEILKLLFYLY